MGMKAPAEKFRHSLAQQKRTYRWLADETGISYKRILRAVKHDTSPLTYVETIQIAHVLGVSHDELARAVAA